jgi:hypothetical protein
MQNRLNDWSRKGCSCSDALAATGLTSLPCDCAVLYNETALHPWTILEGCFAPKAARHERSQVILPQTVEETRLRATGHGDG